MFLDSIKISTRGMWPESTLVPSGSFATLLAKMVSLQSPYCSYQQQPLDWRLAELLVKRRLEGAAI